MEKEILNKILVERRNELLKELHSIDFLIDATDSGDVYNALFSFFLEHPNNDYKNIIEQIQYQNKYAHHGSLEPLGSQSFLNVYGGGKAFPKVEKRTDQTWKMYLLDVIKSLGGVAKTNDIADVMIINVKDLSFIKARQIAADLLPELVKEGRLEVEKGGSKKEGHTYTVKNLDYKIDDINAKLEKYLKHFGTHKDANK